MEKEKYTLPVTYVCFAVGGTDEGIKEEINNTQKMLGKNYFVEFKVMNGTKLLTIKKKSK